MTDTNPEAAKNETAAKTTATKTSTAKAAATPAPEATMAAAKAIVEKATAAKATAAKATAEAEPKPAAKTTARKTATAAKTTAKAAAEEAEPKPAAKRTTARKATAAKTTTKAATTKTAAAEAEPKPAAKTTTRKTTAAKTTTKAATTKTTAAEKAAAEKAATTAEAEAKPAAKRTTTKRAVAAKTTATKTATTKTTAAKATAAKTAAAKAAPAAAEPVAADPKVKARVTKAAAERAAARRERARADKVYGVPANEGVVMPVPEQPVSEFANLPGILIAAAEAAPLAKTGGLADVVGALPKYLAKLGVDARIIMPFHGAIKDRYRMQTEHLFDYNASGKWASRFVGIDKLVLDGVTYYLVDNEFYFGGPIYTGGPFEGEQYGFFQQAVVDALPNLDFHPGIVHCNDWHTALVPFKLKARGKREGVWPPATLLTIHNLGFQGMFGPALDDKLIGDDERSFAWDLGCWNMMKAGVDTCDRVNTVSPTYAQEICTPEFGEGLQNDLAYLRDQGRLWGILNGIDTDTWNPETDECLPARYSVDDLAGKRECKKALLQELGLDEDLDAPLFAMVGRLTPQKGVGLVSDIIEALVPMGAKFVILGSGYPELEAAMRDAENRHRGRVCSYIGYNDGLAHRIYAGSDFFLMPSAFEPCGISQMIAMRYGSLPIVHETGGLKDTVQPYNQFTGEGTGFSFARFDSWDAIEACKRAVDVYWKHPAMHGLIVDAMHRDFGFDKCAHTYAQLYQSMGIW